LVFPLAAAIAYPVWINVLHDRHTSANGGVVFVNRVEEGTASWWWSFAPVAYVVVPAVLGLLAGMIAKWWTTRSPGRLVRSLGDDLTAWDGCVWGCRRTKGPAAGRSSDAVGALGRRTVRRTVVCVE
jgi:hypothetical protein